jgi:hypothetical protein
MTARGALAALLTVLSLGAYSLLRGAINTITGATENLTTYPGLLSPNSGWTAYGTSTGTRFIGRLSNPFAVPSQASGISVNYVYTSPSPLTIGTIISLNYSVDGNATFGTVDGGSAAIHLFVWQNNDIGSNTYRWWCDAGAPLLIDNDQTLSCNINNNSNWSDVDGQYAAAQSTGFSAALANPFAVGFTFGGRYFGHGVWTTSGSAKFKINSYTIRRSALNN